MSPSEALITIMIVLLFCVASGLAAVAGIVAEVVRFGRRVTSRKETKTS